MTTRITWDWKLYDSLSDFDQRIASTQGRGYTRQDACMVAAKEACLMMDKGFGYKPILKIQCADREIIRVISVTFNRAVTLTLTDISGI